MPTVPSKKKPIWLFILIAVLVLICLPATCIGGFAISAVSKQAKLEKTVNVAETHYEKAIDALERAGESIGAFAESESEESALTAEEQLRASRDELATARASIESLDDSEGKTAYLASLDSATASLESIEKMLGSVKLLSELGTRIAQGSEMSGDADDLLEDAIAAGNKGSYSAMKTKARAAAGKYAKASAVFKEADKAEPSAGLKTIVDYIALRKKQADLAVKMADDGKANRISSYNKRAKESRTLGDKADKMSDKIGDGDTDWMDEMIAADDEASVAAGDKADTLRLKALEAFGMASGQ